MLSALLGTTAVIGYLEQLRYRLACLSRVIIRVLANRLVRPPSQHARSGRAASESDAHTAALDVRRRGARCATPPAPSAASGPFCRRINVPSTVDPFIQIR